MLPVMRPRRLPGLNSELSVEVTGTSPPRPKLDRKRKALSERTLHDVAINLTVYKTSPFNQNATALKDQVRLPNVDYNAVAN